MIKGDKLYGRGGADDGYAIFGSLTAIRALQEQKRPARALRGADRGLRGVRQLRPARLHRPPRRPHRQAVAGRVPGLGLRATTTSCGARRRCAAWWSATSTVKVLSEGVHSGDALRHRAVELPRAARSCSSRLEDETHRHDPDRRPARRDPEAAHGAGRAQPPRCSATTVYDKFPLLPGMTPMARATSPS